MLPSQIHTTKGLVIALSGPSGVGKGTVISKVREIAPRIRHSVSVTTRSPREGEIEGVDYYFRTNDEFEQMLACNEILEHDVYCDYYYGTPLKPLIEIIERGEDVIMDITVPGSLAVLDRFPDAVSIFLLPPSFTELKRRLLCRGTESEKDQLKRLEKAVAEIKKAKLFDYVLVNDDLEKTAARILAIAEAERHRYKRLKGIEEAVIVS
ncbi:MAG: guanylate kinase [Saccharofermentanales bacterium]